MFLFVATESAVIVYNITQKDKEQKVGSCLSLIIVFYIIYNLQYNLDNIGCAKHCSVLADSMQESHFMIGRNDVINAIF